MGLDEEIIFGFFDISCVNNTSIAKGVDVWFCLILMVWRYSTEIKEIASGIVVNLIKFHQNAGNNYIFKKIQTSSNKYIYDYVLIWISDKHRRYWYNNIW